MTHASAPTGAPIILVPGFWLGAWAWDEVAGILRAQGIDVTALTLPGLESVDADRSAITAEDHVQAIVHAIRATHERTDRRPVLAAHSGTGFSGYFASDRVPELIAHMVYVDTAPGVGAMDPELVGDFPIPPLEELRQNENLDGLSDAQLATFYERAVPEPGGILRTDVPVTNPARLDIPSTIIATGASSAQYKEWAVGGYSWLAGLNEVRDITWIDLPTSHWVMWSKPRELAAILAGIARAAS
jgi:pimeloyl-ACP methyl ester carboxylesterase